MSEGSLGSGPKDRISVLHKGHPQQTGQETKIFSRICQAEGDREVDSIRIIFMKLRQNTVLIGGMTANVNRFQ